MVTRRWEAETRMVSSCPQDAVSLPGDGGDGDGDGDGDGHERSWCRQHCRLRICGHFG